MKVFEKMSMDLQEEFGEQISNLLGVNAANTTEKHSRADCRPRTDQQNVNTARQCYR